jgi:hypothetical protein
MRKFTSQTIRREFPRGIGKPGDRSLTLFATTAPLGNRYAEREAGLPHKRGWPFCFCIHSSEASGFTRHQRHPHNSYSAAPENNEEAYTARKEKAKLRA